MQATAPNPVSVENGGAPAGANFLFTNVLTPVALGDLFLFLLARCSRRVQIGTFLALLVATWLAFTWHPAPPEPNLREAGIRPVEAKI
jgi:hypothetical protein